MSTTPTTPAPGPLPPLQAADALPPCPACNGYGTADGEPAGDLARDTYDDPGPCAACGGTGSASPAGGAR